MKFFILVLIGSIALLWIDRQGAVFLIAMLIITAPFSIVYWLCIARFCGKPVEREGDIKILEEELQKRSAR